MTGLIEDGNNGGNAEYIVEHLNAFDASALLSYGATRKVKFVTIPGSGGGVWIRELDGAGRAEFESCLMEKRGKRTVVNTKRAYPVMVRLSVVQGPDPSDIAAGKAQTPSAETARLLFPNPRDEEKIGKMSSSVLSLLYRECTKLSGIGADEEEEEAIDLGEAPTPSYGTN